MAIGGGVPETKRGPAAADYLPFERQKDGKEGEQ
jgi:hypothetical protein